MPTFRTSAAGGGTSGSSDRSASITPAVGDLLVIICNASGNTNASPTCSDNNGSGTYTLIGTALKNSSADTLSVFIRTALMVNTTSTTVTVATGSNTAAEIVIIAVSGMAKTGSAAKLQFNTQANQAGGGTPAPAFGASALTGNLTISGVASGDVAGSVAVPNASWTERQDAAQSTPTTGLEVNTRDSGFTGTTITFGGTTSTAFASFALELDGSQALTPGLFTNSNSFFAPTVSATYALTPSLFTDGDTFFAPAVASTYALTPALYTDADTFYAATVSATYTLTPALFTNAQTFYSPTVAAGGAQALTPSLFSNANSFYSATVTAIYTLTPALFTAADTFFAPMVSASNTLTPALYSYADTFYAATVATAYALTPALYNDADTFYAPSVTATILLAPALFTDADTFFAATVSQNGVTQNLTASLFTDNAVFYSASLVAGYNLTPELFIDTDIFYSLIVTPGAFTLAPDLFSNGNTLYAPTLDGGAQLSVRKSGPVYYKLRPRWDWNMR